MSEQKDRAVILGAPDQPSIIRAKHYKVTIDASSVDKLQIINTIRGYIAAGMPLGHVANACESLGYVVERGEMDAPLAQAVGQTKNLGEIIEQEGATLAWHNRGEILEIMPQIAAPISGQELVQVSQAVAEVGNSTQREVIEGIAVLEQKQPTLPAQNDELLSNPYLQAPASLKKAV